MKPDWSSSPPWANYAAQELSGTYLFHEFKPTYLEITGEWRSSGRWAVVPKVTLRPQDTLEIRPGQIDWVEMGAVVEAALSRWSPP